MKVVLDTNVFISGIFWTGSCNRIVNYWREGKFALVTSLKIISELVKVLKDFKIQLSEVMIKEWVDYIVKNSIIVEPKEKFGIVVSDPKDNMFVEVAFVGKVDYVVSQDKHLLKLREFRGIKIVSPEEFLSLKKF